MRSDAVVPETILIPLDGSPEADHVLPFAARLGSSARIRLVLLRVFGGVNLAASHDSQALALALASYKGSWQSAQTTLSATARGLRTNHVRAEVLLEAGDPAAAIVRIAHDQQADLIAMVTHRRRGIDRVLLGSVAERVVQQAHVPILLVPSVGTLVQWTAGRPVDVLVTLDGSEFAETALSPARHLALALSGSLRLLRVCANSEFSAANDYLSKLACDSDAKGLAIHCQVVVGSSPTAAILNEVRDNHIGALAMASHGRGGLVRAVLGSVAAETLALTQVPLLLVRPHKHAFVGRVT